LSAKVAGVDLDLTQVRAFVAAAEQLHFGRAAAQLFLTQQALSKRIARLEQALGEQLFVRGTRGVELSDAGRRFLPHARQLLAVPPRPPGRSVSSSHRGTAVLRARRRHQDLGRGGSAGLLPGLLPGGPRSAVPAC
jgi:Bacterial regulatory helix-turn-helix protein, lysR family